MFRTVISARHLHGHSYRVEIALDGHIDERSGWVMDYADIEQAASPIIAQLDHKTLNDIEGLENPTCEWIALWIENRISKFAAMARLAWIKVQATPTSGAILKGPGA